MTPYSELWQVTCREKMGTE